MASNIVFITGKTKTDYFKKAADYCAGRFFSKGKIRNYSFTGMVKALSGISSEDVEKITWFYMQLNDRRQAGFLYRLVLSFRVRLYFARYYAFFAAIPEKYFAVWNGYYLPDKALVLAGQCWGKTPIYFENGLLPDTTTVDVKGVNFANSMPRDRSFYDVLELPESYDKYARLKPRAPVKSVRFEKIALPKRYIFVPFQVETDTQIIVYGGWIRNMRQLFQEIANALQSVDEDVAFVFKEHPSSHEEYPDLHQLQNQRLIFANGNDTEELITQSEAVITVNSTVGIEALLFGKKVITLGQAFFTIDGLVQHGGSSAQLMDCLAGLPAWQPDAQLVEKFLWYLRERYLVKGSWRSPTEQHYQGLAEKIRELTT